jgi:hypothetical protein
LIPCSEEHHQKVGIQFDAECRISTSNPLLPTAEKYRHFARGEE